MFFDIFVISFDMYAYRYYFIIEIFGDLIFTKEIK